MVIILPKDHPERYNDNKVMAMDDAFKEFNCFGLAAQSDSYKLHEKDTAAMKVPRHI